MVAATGSRAGTVNHRWQLHSDSRVMPSTSASLQRGLVHDQQSAFWASSVILSGKNQVVLADALPEMMAMCRFQRHRQVTSMEKADRRSCAVEFWPLRFFLSRSDDSEKVQTLSDGKGFVDLESSVFFQGHVHALKSLFQAHLQAGKVVTIFQVTGFRQRKSVQSNGKSRWQGWCNRLLRECLFPRNSAARERAAMRSRRIPIELPDAD